MYFSAMASWIEEKQVQWRVCYGSLQHLREIINSLIMVSFPYMPVFTETCYF